MFLKNKSYNSTQLFSFESIISEEKLAKLKKTTSYSFFEIIFKNIPEEKFEILFSDHPLSRPNAPINSLVSALLLKEKKNWSYKELLEQIEYNISVRAAIGWLGQDMESMPFCEATIFNFQNRIKQYNAETGINLFEKVFDYLTKKQLEILKIKTNMQRTDSFLVLSNIKNYGRLELLIEVLIRLYRILKTEDKEILNDILNKYTTQKSNKYIYHLKASDLPHEMEKIGEVYYKLENYLRETYKNNEIFKMFQRVYNDHFKFKLNKIEIKEPRSGGLQSPDDLDATYRKKGKKKAKGQSVNIVETCNPKNDLQLITDITVEPNNKNDNKILEDRIEIIKEKNYDLEELYTDGAYGSAKNDEQFNDLTIEQIQTAIPGKEKNVPIDIEKIEDEKYEVECPNQRVESEKTKTKFKVVFNFDICKNCEFASMCSTLRQKNNRVLYFNENDYLKNQRLKRINKVPLIKQKLRANVEATVKEFGAAFKNGKLKLRGKFKTELYAFCMGIMINFGRIYRYSEAI